MNELSLFTGAGGGVLGSKTLGWKTIGYIEYENYCQKIIKQRIADGILDSAPIFGDIRKFISDGYAESYQGMVDIVTGGFPCQPFSVAGKQAGENDPRNMWPSTIECIRIIRPRFAFLENVPGLLSSGYFGTVLGDLAESGYDCRWDVIGADDVGANHRRKRLWILAYANNGLCQQPINKVQAGRDTAYLCSQNVAYAKENRRDSKAQQEMDGKEMERGRGCGFDDSSKNVPHPDSPGREEQRKPEPDGSEHIAAELRGEEVADPDQSRFQTSGAEQQSARSSGNDGAGSWWSVEPNVGRVVTGCPNRVDRLKSLGNMQVPICMAYAYAKLSQGIVE